VAETLKCPECGKNLRVERKLKKTGRVLWDLCGGRHTIMVSDELNDEMVPDVGFGHAQWIVEIYNVFAVCDSCKKRWEVN
jgi:hypothetical protein